MAQPMMSSDDDPVASRRERSRSDEAYRQKVEAAKREIEEGRRPVGKVLDREGLAKLRFSLLGA